MLSKEAEVFYTAFDKNLIDQETRIIYYLWSDKNALSDLRQICVHWGPELTTSGRPQRE